MTMSIDDVGVDMAMASLVAMGSDEAAGGVEEGSVGAITGLAHPTIVNIMRRVVDIAHFERWLNWLSIRKLLYFFDVRNGQGHRRSEHAVLHLVVRSEQ